MAFEQRPSVLVVDDERGLADLYAAWLHDYDTRAVYGGEAALEELDEDVDVVLLDRHMPDVTGDEVLVSLRDRGLDCRVAMVTAITPDFDVLRLGFDDYLTKPVERDELRERVDRLIDMNSLDELHRRLSTLRVRRNVIRKEKSEAELAADERFERLEARIAALERRLEDRRPVAATNADGRA